MKHQYRCRYCDEKGYLDMVIENTKNNRQIVTIQKDLIPHKRNCPRRVRKEKAKHLRKKKWVAQEKRANKMAGTSPTKNSGSVFGDGDGRTANGFRLECKGTEKDKYRVKVNTWNKLREGALQIGEEPVLHIQLGDGIERTTLVLVRDCLVENTVKIPFKTLDKYDLSDPPKSIPIGKDQVAIITEKEFTCLKNILYPQ